MSIKKAAEISGVSYQTVYNNVKMFQKMIYDEFMNPCEINHSILVGKHCAYCMDCGQIIIEYKNNKDFKKLMKGELFATSK